MAKLGAGVRKRADGNLEKRFTVNGKRYSVYGKTQKEISAKEQEIRKKIDAGIYKDNRNITLDKYFEEWIATKRGKIKGSTLRGYLSYYNNHISSLMGSRRVQQIERREVINLQTVVAEELSKHAANYCVKLLKIMLNDAVADEIIDRNPAEGIKNLKDTAKAAETYHRALTEDEQAAFMQEIKSDYHYELIALLISTGMRCGEACALTWKDIDYKNNVIHVTKTLTYDEVGNWIIGDSTKTKSSKRDIPINATIKEILAKQHAKMGNIVSINKNTTVFMAVEGGYIYNITINRAIAAALERLEAAGTHIDRFTAHALRDTFATRYIEQGGNPQTLKTILGHSSLAMTMDLYAHVLPNTKQQEMDSIHIAI